MNKLSTTKLLAVVALIFSIGMFSSCNEEYELEKDIPSWLGKSIYDYLENKGNYTNYVRLINDMGQKEVLAKTGSKTLFVADDEAFDRFYKSNSWGVSKYDDLSDSQKKLIFNSSMLNNAMLIENLATLEGAIKGQVMRRNTALSVSDTISLEAGNTLPSGEYWDTYRNSGIRLSKDGTSIPMLIFTREQMNMKKITANDFSILFNGKTLESQDAYIFDIKVKERDIVCQNGYIHVLEDVLIPASNMAETIRTAPETNIFSSLLERFSAPYYDENLTNQFSALGYNEDVYVKGYFSERSATVPYNSDNKTCLAPNGEDRISDVLSYDPGWNGYFVGSGSYQTDMAAIFCPSDQALNTYFTDGGGRSLIERYGSIENIPLEVLNKLVRNHMKASFLNTIPSMFYTIVDDAQEVMGIEDSHINKVYLTANGAVYVTNTVYPPALYSSVMFPAVINENMRVFNWAIEQLEFNAYLLSMVNYYSFLIPTDHFTYILPNAAQADQPLAYKFHYNNATKAVYASVHYYDPQLNSVGDSVSVITSTSMLKDHLEDMLDYHIIVGDIEDGKEYYRTKGNGTIRVGRNGDQLLLAGGGDVDRNATMVVSETYDQTPETNGRGNGKTYIIDNPVQSPLRSVYKILSETPQFSKFYELLSGNDALWDGDTEGRLERYSVFYRDKSQVGLDYNVRFLNTFHYTLYVPTNDAVEKAYAMGLPTWEEVEAETDIDERDKKAEMIIRFLRYHFQDNAVYLDNNTSTVTGAYETATLNEETETFYKLNINSGNYSLSLTTHNGGQANVIKSSGLYNMMARDFKFNTADASTSTLIETSAYTVIHQIDNCLFYENDQFKN